MPRAAVDIGSNTILLLVIDDQGKPIHDEAIVVGLGQGLGSKGIFRPDRMDAALAALTTSPPSLQGSACRRLKSPSPPRAQPVAHSTPVPSCSASTKRRVFA